MILGVLNEFGKQSGLFLNMLKSTVFVPRKMDHNVKESIASHCAPCVSTNFGKYLGVHITPNKPRKSNYLDLLEKTKDRIRGWEAKILNMADRCTLIKLVLNTYPLHIMQTNIIPIGVLNDI